MDLSNFDKRKFFCGVGILAGTVLFASSIAVRGVPWFLLGCRDRITPETLKTYRPRIKGTQIVVKQISVPKFGIKLNMDIGGTDSQTEYYGGGWIEEQGGSRYFCRNIRILAGPDYMEIEPF